MSETRRNGKVHAFAVFTACCTFLLLIAGALVTSNDAGLAVPDWPLSYGSLMPPMVGGIFYEHGHRMIAAFVGLLSIILAAWLWRVESRRWVRWLGVAAVGAVVVQGILGGLTVLFFLPVPISVAHATLSQIFFCTIMSTALFTSAWWERGRLLAVDAPGTPIFSLGVATAAAALLQLVLGAVFRHQGFGIIPHLFGAAVVTALMFWFAAALRLDNPDLSSDENRALYGPCNTMHGHNYELEVTIRGPIARDTGMVMNLSWVADLVRERIWNHVDHKNLNTDVAFLEGVIPTAENLAVAFWNQLFPHMESRSPCRLHMIRVRDSQTNSVEYYGPEI